MTKWLLVLGLLTGVQPSCQLAASVQETGDVLVEQAPGLVGALLGWLATSTPLGIVVGGVMGALVSDDVEHRMEVEALEDENAELREELAAKPTTAADAAISFFDALKNLGYAGAGGLALLALLFWVIPSPFNKRKRKDDEKAGASP